VRAVPRLCEFYPGICLQLRKMHGKPSVRVRKTSVRVRKTSVRVENAIINCIVRVKIHRCFHQVQQVTGLGRRSRYSDSLWAGRSGDRIPVGARFFPSVQTGTGAHPSSYILGTRSSPGVIRPGSDIVHLPHLSPKLKKV
jgi:hypothetical protein